MYIVVVYRSPPLVSTFYARLKIISQCVPKIKNRKLYIWPLFTCINKTFDTGHLIHVTWLPLRVVRPRKSVYFFVRFSLSDERTWVSSQENSIGADSESLLTAQPSHIWWDYKNYTRDIFYAYCDIEPSCLHSLKCHFPYNPIYPHPCLDDSNYSYPSLIRKGANVCDHSAIYRKLFAVEWVSDEQNKCKLQKHKLTVIYTTSTRVWCFLMWNSFSGPNRSR